MQYMLDSDMVGSRDTEDLCQPIRSHLPHPRSESSQRRRKQFASVPQKYDFASNLGREGDIGLLDNQTDWIKYKTEKSAREKRHHSGKVREARLGGSPTLHDDKSLSSPLNTVKSGQVRNTSPDNLSTRRGRLSRSMVEKSKLSSCREQSPKELSRRRSKSGHRHQDSSEIIKQSSKLSTHKMKDIDDSKERSFSKRTSPSHHRSAVAYHEKDVEEGEDTEKLQETDSEVHRSHSDDTDTLRNSASKISTDLSETNY